MADEDDFLNALRANPADDTTRLVYADWLDENPGDGRAERAEYLRLEAEKAAAEPERMRAIEGRLAALSAGVPSEWEAVVSKRPIEQCRADERVPLPEFKFAFTCPKEWQQLTPTADEDVRFCPSCEQSVYYCRTVLEARNHAWSGRCVAVDVGQPRTPDDLKMRRIGSPGIL